MTGTFKEFYKFVNCINPFICNIWEDFHNRPNPKSGDKFLIKKELQGLDGELYYKVIFERVEFDQEYKNGVAFYYIFKKEDDKDFKISIHSINDIYDTSNLTIQEQTEFLNFWKRCIPNN